MSSRETATARGFFQRNVVESWTQVGVKGRGGLRPLCGREREDDCREGETKAKGYGKVMWN